MAFSWLINFEKGAAVSVQTLQLRGKKSTSKQVQRVGGGKMRNNLVGLQPRKCWMKNALNVLCVWILLKTQDAKTFNIRTCWVCLGIEDLNSLGLRVFSADQVFGCTCDPGRWRREAAAAAASIAFSLLAVLQKKRKKREKIFGLWAGFGYPA